MDPTTELISLVIILLTSLGIAAWIYGKRDLEFRHIYFIALILRIIFLLADYYKWFPVPNSGGDSEDFHEVALDNVKGFMYKNHTNYIHIVSFIYEISNCSRLLAQFFNVLLGMGTIYIINKGMDLLRVSYRTKLIALLILALLPNLNILAAILLREAWVEFFVALSVYAFIKWFVKGGAFNIILCTVGVFAAAYMHAGVIVLLFGYIIAFLSYDPESKKITFSTSTIISLIFLAGITLAVSSYLDLFTGKLQKYEEMDDIVDVTNRNRMGGSDYLLWISTDSVAMSLAFAPLKMFYFLFSPLPTEWRGVKDIVGFLIDGAVYMFICYVVIKQNEASELYTKLKKYLIVTFLMTVFVFAYGTSNAGTAFRHRNKIVSVAIILFAISHTSKKKNKYELNS